MLFYDYSDNFRSFKLFEIKFYYLLWEICLELNLIDFLDVYSINYWVLLRVGLFSIFLFCFFLFISDFVGERVSEFNWENPCSLSDYELLSYLLKDLVFVPSYRIFS